MPKINFWEVQSLDQLKVPTASKIALVASHYTVLSNKVMVTMFIIYQLQILTIALKPAFLSIQREGKTSSELFDTIHSMLFLEDLDIINRTSNGIMWVTCFLGAYLFLITLFVCYMVELLYKKRAPWGGIEKIWNVLVCFHHYILFYPIHIFCIKILFLLFQSKEEEERRFLTEGYEDAIKILCFAVISLNILWSVSIVFFLKIGIKTKNLLTTKTIALDLFDLAFKISIPIAESFISNSEGSTVTLLAANLLYFIFRDCILFHFLPYYRLFILKLSTVLHSLITSFAFAALFSRPISHARSYTESAILFLMWILFYIIIQKLYSGHIKKLLLRILQHPAQITNPYHLLHYLVIYKAFSKYPAVGVKTIKAQENYLHYMATVKRSAVGHLLPSKLNEKLDAKTQDMIDKHFISLSLDLLNKSIRRNSSLLILKATLAYYYAKYEKLYVLANQILDEYLSSSIIQKNTFCLIKLIILKKIKTMKHKQENKNLDQDNDDDSIGNENSVLELEKYIQLQRTFRDLKKEIIQQLKLQTNYWKQFQTSDSDFVSLVNIATKIYKKAKKIKKTSLSCQIFKELGFTEPLLVYSLYFYFVQNDLAIGHKFLDDYYQLESRKKLIDNSMQKRFKTNNLKDSLYFILSAYGDQPGTILNCSGQVNKAFGIPKQMLIKNSLGFLMPQVYAKWYNDFLRNAMKSPESEVLSEVMEIPILVQTGYIVPYWIYLTLTYLSEFGLCYSGLMAPLRDNKRIVIITGDGQICNYSKEFADDLNITPEKRKKMDSIFTFCPTLEGIIESFKPFGAKELHKNIYHQNKNYQKNAYTQEKLSTEEASKNINDFVKETCLNFFLSPSKQRSYSINQSRKENKKFVVYKAQINMRIIQEINLFEIKMEKVDDKNNIASLDPEKKSTCEDFYKTTYAPDNRVLSYENENKKQEPIQQIPDSLNSNKKVEGYDKFTFSKNELNNESPGFEGSEKISKKITKDKNKKNDWIKYTQTIETGGETPTYPLTSPVSEKRNLISIAKGDIDNDLEACSNEKDVFRVESSVSLAQKKGNINHQVALDLKELESNLLKEILGKDDSNFSSIANVQETDIYKMTLRAVESKRYQNSSLVYTMCFIVTMFILMAFLIWLNFNTSQTSTTVGNLSQVIQDTYFSNFWVKTSINDMIFWVAVRGTFLDYDVELLQNNFLQDFYRLNGFTENLRKHLSLLDYEIQEPFYQRQVDVYERDKKKNLQLISLDNIFEVTKKLITYGIKNGNKVNEILPDTDFIDYDTYFIFDNGLNTLTLTLEKLAAKAEAKQLDTINNSKKLMKAVFSGTLAVLVLFIFASLVFIIKMNKSFTDFIGILYTVPSQEITRMLYSFSTLIEMLEKDSSDIEILDSFNLLRRDSSKKAVYSQSMKGDQAKGNRSVIQRASMKKFKTMNYLIFLGLFVCLGFVIIFMVIYYNMALNKIQVMERQHTNLNSALNVLNSFAIVIPGLGIMTLTNDTTMIKHLPTMEFVKDSISKISRVSDFQASLKDSNGEFSSTQKEILFSYSCTKAYSPLWAWSLEVMQPECEYISDGLNYVGLFKLIPQLEVKLQGFIEVFEAGPRDIQFLKDRFNDVLIISFTTDISFVLLFQLFTDSTNNFHELVINLEEERVTLAWIACLISLALGTITWLFIVRKLTRKEFQKKKLMKLVPTRLIFENFLLKKCVSQIK